jgi:pimeloyl-ACP methyl ester carboxylesterase
MNESIKTSDGQTISYRCSGNGPGLVMLHGGFIQDKRIWSDLSYVDSLKNNYTVITMDIRGHGESSKPKDEKYYSIDFLVSDIEAIVRAVGLNNFMICGFSLGASIALHMSTMRRLKGVIAIGSFFGQELIDYGNQNIPGIEETLKAIRENLLNESSLSPQEKFFIDNTDLEVVLAIFKAMARWPKIEPSMVQSPTMLLAGKADEPIYSVLKRQSSDIQSSGIKLSFIDGLDHFQTLTEKDKVFPEMRDFLSRCHI